MRKRLRKQRLLAVHEHIASVSSMDLSVAFAKSEAHRRHSGCPWVAYMRQVEIVLHGRVALRLRKAVRKGRKSGHTHRTRGIRAASKDKRS